MQIGERELSTEVDMQRTENLTGESVNVPTEGTCVSSQGLAPQALSVVSTAVEAGGSVLESEDLVLFLRPIPIIQEPASHFPNIDSSGFGLDLCCVLNIIFYSCANDMISATYFSWSESLCFPPPHTHLFNNSCASILAPQTPHQWS